MQSGVYTYSFSFNSFLLLPHLFVLKGKTVFQCSFLNELSARRTQHFILVCLLFTKKQIKLTNDRRITEHFSIIKHIFIANPLNVHLTRTLF